MVSTEMDWLKERKIVAGFGAAFLLILAAGGISYLSFRQYAETTRLVIRTQEVRSQLDSLLSAMVDIETGMRGYLLAGNPTYLEPYEEALPRLWQAAGSVRTLTADNPRQQERMDRLVPLLQERVALARQRVLTRQSLGLEAAAKEASIGLGKQKMDAIRALVAEMVEEEDHLLQQRTAASETSADRAIVVSAISTVLAFLLLVICFQALRRAEQAAHRARAYTESIVETVREPLLVLSADLRVLSANRSFYRSFSTTPQETEGRLLFELGGARWDIPRLRSLLKDILPQNTHFDDFEVEQDSPGRGRRTLLLNARRIYRPGNHTETILLAIEDITDRKRAERELRQSAEEIRDLYNSAPCGYHSLDGDGAFVAVNDTELAWLGYARDEVLGKKKFPDLLTPASQAAFREYFPALKERGRVRDIQLEIVRKDGTTLPVLLNATVHRSPDGTFVTSRATLVDTTELHVARGELARQSRILQSVLENMGDGVAVADEKGKFLVFNPAAERILGTGALDVDPAEWSREYGIYMPDGVTQYPAEDLPMARALRGEELDGQELFVRHAKIPAGIWLSVTARPMKRVNGGVRGGVVVFRDVTQQKKAEKELRQAKEQAERASRFKDQFLSTMSHELRTPLNAVLGFSELLLDESYGPVNERQHRYLNHIRTGGQHLLRLINDILDLSKIEAGRLELTIEEVPVESSMSQVLSALRPLADKKSQTLSHQVEEQLCVQADATRFQQVLMNLVGNAIKFTPQGGRVELRAQLVKEEVRVEVRDNGPGIPPEEQKRIFDAFYRLRQAGQATEGTGLGLAITQRLVEVQGGRLGIESEPGKGSCFYFYLPTATEPRVFRPAEPARAESRQGSAILVVEDDPISAQLIETQLRSAGYDPVLCNEPREAAEIAARLQPLAITLDVLMRPMSGFEVLLELKNDPRTINIPVIVVSIVDQPGLGATLGADEYLVKPVEKERLLAAVRRCLERRGIASPQRPILVVEDDRPTREMVCDLLKDAGFPFTSASDGSEARESVGRSLPELVILDLILPKVSGFDLLAEWRSNARTETLPVFVLTSKELTHQEEAYLRKHAESLFLKHQPWQDDLIRQVRRIKGPEFREPA